MKVLHITAAAVLAAFSSAQASNILWVSDNGPEGTAPNGAFGPAGSGFSDDGYIGLLQGAGHTVSRYNPPNATALSATDIGVINTADLVIIGRSIASGAFQASSGAPQWNKDVTAPVLAMNAYLSRGSRLGWFAGSTLEDAPGTRLTAIDIANPITRMIFGGIGFELGGTTTVDNYNIRLDRGTSTVQEAPVAGGMTLATSTFTPTDGAPAAFTAVQIASWPEGTSVRGGAETLGGYRLYFATGSREPDGGSVAQAGKLDLTADGQRLFMNSVALAVAEGVPEPSPAVLFALGATGLLFLRHRRRN